MVQRFEQIIAQAKYDYNLGVHEFLRFVFGWHLNCTGKLMDVSLPPSQGGNLD